MNLKTYSNTGTFVVYFVLPISILKPFLTVHLDNVSFVIQILFCGVLFVFCSVGSNAMIIRIMGVLLLISLFDNVRYCIRRLKGSFVNSESYIYPHVKLIV